MFFFNFKVCPYVYISKFGNECAFRDTEIVLGQGV